MLPCLPAICDGRINLQDAVLNECSPRYMCDVVWLCAQDKQRANGRIWMKTSIRLCKHPLLCSLSHTYTYQHICIHTQSLPKYSHWHICKWCLYCWLYFKFPFSQLYFSVHVWVTSIYREAKNSACYTGAFTPHRLCDRVYARLPLLCVNTRVSIPSSVTKDGHIWRNTERTLEVILLMIEPLFLIKT